MASSTASKIYMSRKQSEKTRLRIDHAERESQIARVVIPSRKSREVQREGGCDAGGVNLKRGGGVLSSKRGCREADLPIT